MTKPIFDNLPDLAPPTPPARRSSSRRPLAGMPVPLHPGAARYFKEKGVMK